MVDTIKKGDFVELDFSARLDATGALFDTTQEAVAKKEGVYSKEIKYKPVIITAGEHHLLKGLDEFIIGKPLGKYTVHLPAEKAFGKKDAKLLRLISIGEFRKHKIEAMPGLEVELDGNRGIIRTVNGGRVIVDFNHPLASQDITYEIELKRIVTDNKEKIEGVLNTYKIPYKAVAVEEGKATIEFGMPIPGEVTKPIADEIVRLVGVKDILFK